MYYAHSRDHCSVRLWRLKAGSLCCGLHRSRMHGARVISPVGSSAGVVGAVNRTARVAARRCLRGLIQDGRLRRLAFFERTAVSQPMVPRCFVARIGSVCRTPSKPGLQTSSPAGPSRWRALSTPGPPFARRPALERPPELCARGGRYGFTAPAISPRRTRASWYTGRSSR